MNTNIDWLIMKHGVTRRRINERRYNKDCKMISEENELMKNFVISKWIINKQQLVELDRK